MTEQVPAATAGKPIRCQAAVARGAGEPLLMEEVIVAPPKPFEARIRIICSSLCHSDLAIWHLKDPPGYFPRILGHESFGVVESVGEGVHEVAEGDLVIPVILGECGECVDCISKKSNLCSTLPFKVSPWMPRDKTSRFTDLKGETIYHMLNISSFSQYTIVDVGHLVKVHSAIPPNRACLLGCGISTGVGAAWRTANVEAGSTVAIFGLGAIGLAVAEGARLYGAARIIGVDVNPEKFALAKKFGVTDFILPGSCGDKSVSQIRRLRGKIVYAVVDSADPCNGRIINEMTDRGADYCFECVGLASLVQEAYDCCRMGWGKTIVVGVDKPGAQLMLPSVDVLHHGKILMGSLFGGLKPKSDVPILVDRYMNKELNLDEFVTHEMKIEDINKAFELLMEGRCLRCVLWMDD